MATKTPNKNQRQKHALYIIILIAAILICINILTSFFHIGIDLTNEKRFTLSNPTKKMLAHLQEVAVIDVYLSGKLPAQYQRMQEAVRERLQSFKEIAGNRVVFRFINPLEGKTDDEQKQIVHNLEQKGIRFIERSSKDETEYNTQKIFPFALVQYNGKEMPIYLLEQRPVLSPEQEEEMITYAEALLEYKFANAINTLGKPTRPHIAYITGNDEMLDVHTEDMLSTLPYYYDLDTIDITHLEGQHAHIPAAYDAIIINQPVKPFTGPEKLKIDQYIMHGGHVLWVINNIKASLDSFITSPQFIAMDYGLEIDELLFKYGVRVNNDLVEDKQCMPLGRTYDGQIDKKDWIFFPRINPTNEHPIVRNMDFILGEFTNSIDTLKSTGIKKTVLLQTSKYSRTASAPARVSLSLMNYPIPEKMFNKSYIPIAMLLEGTFHSAFQNRLAPDYLRLLDSLHLPFKKACDTTTSMIVISVGNIFRNEYSAKNNRVINLGFYQYDSYFYQNMNFLLNCMEFLTDKSGILESRSKESKLRLLDTGRIKEEKNIWQTINVSIPIALVLIFASCFIFFKKRKYETK